MSEYLVYAAVVGLIIVLALPVFSWLWKAIRGLFTSSAPTTGVSAAVDTAGRWAAYAAARAAIGELRVVDFTNASLDIHGELDAIESKLAVAMKGSAS